MDALSNLIIKVYEEILNDLKERDYILADTRIETVSLYDHLVLTAGIAVAIIKELFEREKTPEEICGEKLSEEDLISIIKIASLLHDIGKDDEEAYKNHQKRSVERTKILLEENNIEQPYFNLILSAVKRHQLNYNPEMLHEKIVCLADSLASAGDRPELSKATNIVELTKISESSYNLFQSVFDDDNGLVLILADVDKVKDYVYETSKLPEIRGASQILNELNYEKLEELFERYLSKECLIYNGGGTFLAIAPKSIANDITNEIQNRYLSETKIATITCVISKPLGYFEFSRGLMPYDNEEIKKLEGSGVGKWLLESHFGKFSSSEKSEWFEEDVEICKKKGFGEIVSLISEELRKNKSNKEVIPFFEAIPIGRRCQSCGKRVATAIDKSRTPEEFICEVCNIKRIQGGPEGRLKFLLDFGDWIKEKKNKEIDIALKIPLNLDELVLKNDGYMAFIYADGNDIGSLINKAKSPANYRHISISLKAGIKNSLFDALFETFIKDEKLNKFEKLPFEIINIGGDDISLIVAGPFAFEFSANFLEFFERESSLKRLSEELNENVMISLGMVICKFTYPVYFAEKIADSLLKDAKTKYKDLPKEKKENTISYVFLTSSIAIENGKDIIETIYKNKSGILTLRPYTLSELKCLLEISDELKEIFSATQRNTLMNAFFRGKFQSMNFLFYQISRMKIEKMKKIKEILHNIHQKFDPTKDLELIKNLECGWMLVDGKDATPIIDLLEITKIRGGN